MGLNSESWSYIESIYPRGVLGLLSQTQAKVWNFFEQLAWDTYEFDQAKQNFGYPTQGEFVFLINPYHQDHLMNSYDLFQSYVTPVLCDYCESSDHDACNCNIVLIFMLNVQVWKR